MHLTFAAWLRSVPEMLRHLKAAVLLTAATMFMYLTSLYTWSCLQASHGHTAELLPSQCSTRYASHYWLGQLQKYHHMKVFSIATYSIDQRGIFTCQAGLLVCGLDRLRPDTGFAVLRQVVPPGAVEPIDLCKYSYADTCSFCAILPVLHVSELHDARTASKIKTVLSFYFENSAQCASLN